METLQCPHCNDRFNTVVSDGLPDSKMVRCKRCQQSFSLGEGRQLGRVAASEPDEPEQFDETAGQVPEDPYAPIPEIVDAVSPGPPYRPNSEGDATGGVIPYKNPKALIAYYLGIFSGLPIIGLPLGIAAFTLGFMGLSARKKNPAIKGSVHAGIGIGCGCLFTVVWGGVIVVIVVGMISSQR